MPDLVVKDRLVVPEVAYAVVPPKSQISPRRGLSWLATRVDTTSAQLSRTCRACS